MPKFVDKMNLPQYRFFNNMLLRDEDCKGMVADILTAGHQMQYGDKRGFMDAMKILADTKNRIADFLYPLDEDKEKCRQKLKGGNVRKQQKLMEQYADILMTLKQFQGASYTKERPLSKELTESMTQKELARKYKYSNDLDCYCMEVSSIPKLVLINRNLFEDYLYKEFTEKECDLLEQLLSDDVHYILNVQEESQAEIAYMVERGKDRKPMVHILHRDKGARRNILIRAGELDNDVGAVILSLVDYLNEMAKAEKKRRRIQPGEDTQPNHRNEYVPRYVDKNSIKIYDIAKKEDGEMDVFQFHKRKGGMGIHRNIGYEVIPHTRKGHFRTYKNGKTVYVRPAIIHRDKYDSIQAAHRMNEPSGK